MWHFCVESRAASIDVAVVSEKGSDSRPGLAPQTTAGQNANRLGGGLSPSARKKGDVGKHTDIRAQQDIER
jgi:hypothetical protein